MWSQVPARSRGHVSVLLRGRLELYSPEMTRGRYLEVTICFSTHRSALSMSTDTCECAAARWRVASLRAGRGCAAREWHAQMRVGACHVAAARLAHHSD
jgi:hypothetical protein